MGGRLVARMQELFGAFCEKHLPIPEADAPFFTELTTGKTPSATYAAWPQLRSVRRVCIRSDIGARSWYMSFNHATCGGGDFLRAGGSIVEGEVHDLIEPPRSNVFGLLCCLEWFRWMAFSGNILRPLPPVERLSGGPIEWPRLCFSFPVASCAKPDGEKIKVSTRVRVAHRMLEAIAAGLDGVIVGLSLGAQPLLSQAYGAGNLARMSIVLQRTMLLSAVFLVVLVLPMWIFCEPLLLAAGQPPLIARLTGEFVLWRLPALPPRRRTCSTRSGASSPSASPLCWRRPPRTCGARWSCRPTEARRSPPPR